MTLNEMFEHLRQVLKSASKTVSEGKKKIYIPEIVLNKTTAVILSYGSGVEMHEGVAYWGGVETQSSVVVTTVFAPKAETTPGSYNTSALDNAQVIRHLNDHQITFVAQIHGHPSEWVDHSPGDDIGAFMPYPGLLSIVVPNYGSFGMSPLTKCGIHEYQIEGHFDRLSVEEISTRFVVLPTSLDLR